MSRALCSLDDVLEDFMRTFDPSAVHDGQRSCRSMLDAVVRLSELNAAVAPARMVIRAGLIQRPDGVKTGIILVEAEIEGRSEFLRLPNCNRVQAESAGTAFSLVTSVLIDAPLDECGSVWLSDGRELHHVTMKPEAPVMYHVSKLDDAIARYTVMLRQAEGRCYRRIAPELSDVMRSQATALDYAMVRETPLSDFKQLLPQIQIGFPDIPERDIKKSLRRSGFKFPRS